MEFKKLGAVEVVAAVDQAATVLIEKDGVIKRAPKNEIGAQADWAETDSTSPAFIKNKPAKELIYEWNFTPSDTTNDIIENVAIDLSSLFEDKDTKFEVSVEQYFLENFYDEDSGNWSEFELVEDGISAWNHASWTYAENIPAVPGYTTDIITIWSSGAEYYSETNGHAIMCESWADIRIVNGFNFNLEDGSFSSVANGGIIAVSSASPFKSIKIYKTIE